jgi:hypothetical protein
MKRAVCLAVGCRQADYGPCCERCHADMFSGEFVERGALAAFRQKLQWLSGIRRRVLRRCVLCRRRMWFARADACSEQCHEDRIPF